jgi:hypothetical protein
MFQLLRHRHKVVDTGILCFLRLDTNYHASTQITQAEALIQNLTLILIGYSKVFVSHLQRMLAYHTPLITDNITQTTDG